MGLILFLSSSCLQARSTIYTAKRIDTVCESAYQTSVVEPAKVASTYHYARQMHEGASFARPVCKKGLLKYDITRETGAYFFDTVYKLKMPATKLFSIGLNGGYTYFNRYAHGFGRAGSIGLVGGLSLTMRGNTGGQKLKKGFLRLNADLISYGYRKVTPVDGRQASLLDKYTRELSTRVYFDGRFNWRSRAGNFTTRCMIGMVAGSEQITSATPFFVGAGLAYRFL